MSLVTMYDGISPSEVPRGGAAYMGYLNGAWPSYAELVKMHPTAKHVSVSVTASANVGDVLDVENGDAMPNEAPGWVAKRRAAGAHWVAVYTNDSTWPTVKAAFAAAKVPEPYWFIAAYPGVGPTLESGTIGHQYENTPGYDVSVVDSTWLDLIGTPAPKPKPAPVPAPKPAPAPVPLTADQYAAKHGMVRIDVAEARQAIAVGISYYTWQKKILRSPQMYPSRSRKIPTGTPLFAFAASLDAHHIPHAGA